MADVTIPNSPVHSDIIITYPYGIADPGYSCGWHTGVDFAPYGATENNPVLYPVKDGTVVATPVDNVLGYQAQILDSSGHYWRYCHMVAGSVLVNVGDTVTINTAIGRMGATGNVTGRHLHLECSTTQSWQCATFINPCDILGIPNIDNTVIKFGGTPPVPPTPIIEKKKFPWPVYFRKLRNKRVI